MRSLAFAGCVIGGLGVLPVQALSQDVPIDPVARSGLMIAAGAEATTVPTDSGTAAAIPAGWTTHTLAGVTFAAPADWPVMEEGRNDLGLGEFNPSEKWAFMAGITLERDSLDDMLAEAADDGVPLTEGPTVTVSGQTFRTLEGDIPEGTDGMPGAAHVRGMISSLPNADGRYIAVMTMVMGRPWEDFADTMDQLLASVSLDASAGLPGLGGAEGTGQGGSLGGLLSYAAPPGWGVVRDSETQVSVMAYGMKGYVLVERGDDARDSLDLTHAFADPPTATDGTILGQSARVFEGLTLTAEVMGSTGEAQGIKRVHALATCLADGTPLSITTVGAPDWLEGGGLAPMLEAMTLTLPDDAAPCAEDVVVGAPATDVGAPDDLAAAALERGQALQAEGDYPGALMAYRESVAASPNAEIKARIEKLERYLDLQGIAVPPAQ